MSLVSLAEQQAYARQVQARRPVKTREIKASRQLIELVCFLRIALLKLAARGVVAMILAISSLQRSPALPDVPTIAEAGLPGFATLTWVGFFAPAGTPAAIISRLNSEVNKIMQLPDVQQRIAALGAQAEATTPQQFDAFLRKEIAEQGAVIKSAGIKAD